MAGQDNASTNDASPAGFGSWLRRLREEKEAAIRNMAAAADMDSSHLGKVERGSESVQWGKLFQVLEGLGIRVMVDVPEDVAAHLEAVRSKGQS